MPSPVYQAAHRRCGQGIALAHLEHDTAMVSLGHPKSPRLFNIEERMAAGSSLLGTQNDDELFSLEKFEAWITGHLDGSYLNDVTNFHATAHLFKTATEQADEDYATLWLDVQFFWDMMLRMQPNSITEDLVSTESAVDLMMDVTAARLALDMLDECTTEVARLQIREFRRRLQRFQLFLRSTVGTCGKGPKMLCGCLVTTKQYQDKGRMWAKSPILNIEPEETLFRVRDIARMLRLEDFVLHEVENYGRQSDDCVLLVLSQVCFDEQVRKFLPEGEIETVGEMKRAWLKALCDSRLRKLVANEVREIIKDAVEFRKQKGCNHHRKECEHHSFSKSKVSRKYLEPIDIAQVGGESKTGESKGNMLLNGLKKLTPSRNSFKVES